MTTRLPSGPKAIAFKEVPPTAHLEKSSSPRVENRATKDLRLDETPTQSTPGKLVDCVCPQIATLPSASTAIPVTQSESVPPKNVENKRLVPSALSLAR